MDWKHIHKIFFIGIGGIGMSALARYFKHLGKDVSGYDLTPTPLTEELLSEGIAICFDEDTEKLPENIDLVIYTPAVPDDNLLFSWYQSRNVPFLKRSEVLGILSEETFTIAIAGTHGKTSISAITAHLLKSSGLSVTALFGGISKNYGSNVILSKSPEYLLLEADEYDRSFLTLKPDIAVVSSIDEDHLDIYNNIDSLLDGFRKFTGGIRSGGVLIYQSKLKTKLMFDGKSISYSADKDADIYAKNITIENGYFVFDFVSDKMRIKNIKLHVPGLHYIENTLAAIAVGIHLGLNEKQIKEGVENFNGVERRFDTHFSGNVVYIDDYAHHPEEIRATIHAVRMLYPGRKIIGAFQPHLYSRTRDFANEFAAALSALDEVILLDIYPAREKPIPGVSSEMILKKISGKNKFLLDKAELIAYAGKLTNEIFLTLGAGDIGLLAEKIKNRLTT